MRSADKDAGAFTGDLVGASWLDLSEEEIDDPFPDYDKTPSGFNLDSQAKTCCKGRTKHGQVIDQIGSEHSAGVKGLCDKAGQDIHRGREECLELSSDWMIWREPGQQSVEPVEVTSSWVGKGKERKRVPTSDIAATRLAGRSL